MHIREVIDTGYEIDVPTTFLNPCDNLGSTFRDDSFIFAQSFW